MAVQVWIGEKPENPNERKAIIALANGLDRLEGLYLMIANFSVGGHTIDLVVIKNDAIFIVEMKHCDGKVFGSVNGRWKVVGNNGAVKWLNQGRKNPYNQVIAYYYALRNFLHSHRLDFLSEQKASMVDFRACKRVIVISPTLEAGSEINLDWRVAVKGLDEMPTYLVTERTDEIVLTETEMEAIPRLLNCEPWTEVNKLVAGVMPPWQDTPSEPPAPAPPEPPAPVATPAPPPIMPPSQWSDRSSQRTTLLVMGWVTVLVLLVVILNQSSRPLNVAQLPSTIVSPIATLPFDASPMPVECSATAIAQTVRKSRDDAYIWRTITTNPSAAPYVAVTLDRIEFCPSQIVLHWSVINHSPSVVQMGLSGRNIQVRDTSGTIYTPANTQAPIRVRPDQVGTGSTHIERGVNPLATSLTIELQDEPFGRQIYSVPIPTP